MVHIFVREAIICHIQKLALSFSNFFGDGPRGQRGGVLLSKTYQDISMQKRDISHPVFDF